MYINEHIIQRALYVKCRASPWLHSLGRTWVHGEITPVICAGLCQQYTSLVLRDPAEPILVRKQPSELQV